MNLAVIGAGAVVSGILEAQKEYEDIRVKAICGLPVDRDRMKELSLRYSIEEIVYDYDSLLNSETIDTIYLAVPNRYHFSYAKKAIKAKKNVIIEKPFATDPNDAKELAEMVKEYGCFVFEAISNQYASCYEKIKEWIPLLGELKIVSINYSAFSKRYTAFKSGEKIYPCFDLNSYGDVMTDMGIYCLHFVLGLFGKPEAIEYLPNKEKGVDTSGIIIMRYSGFLCSMIVSKDSRGKPSISIQGVDGVIESDSYVNDPVKAKLSLYEGYELKYQEAYETEEDERFNNELRFFYEMVKNSDYQKRDEALSRSLLAIEVMDECLRQIGIRFREGGNG